MCYSFFLMWGRNTDAPWTDEASANPRETNFRSSFAHLRLVNIHSLSARTGSEESDRMLSEEEAKDDGPADTAAALRERNRKHAKKTRLRKKEMLEGMKDRLLELQIEVRPFISVTYAWPLPPH